MSRKPQAIAVAVAAILSGCHFLPTDAKLAGTYVGQGGDLIQLAAPLGSAGLLADISTYGENGSSCKLSGSTQLATTRLRFTADDQPACNFVIGVGGGEIRLPRHIPAACKRFCSGTASLDGRMFQRTD